MGGNKPVWACMVYEWDGPVDMVAYGCVLWCMEICELYTDIYGGGKVREGVGRVSILLYGE